MTYLYPTRDIGVIGPATSVKIVIMFGVSDRKFSTPILCAGLAAVLFRAQSLQKKDFRIDSDMV